jgi:predicted dehydrogenase
MSDKRSIPRRRFLQSAAAGVLAAPYFVPSAAVGAPGKPGASDRVNVAIVGCGIRGKYLIANLPPSARVVALCDCDAGRIAGTLDPKNEFAAPLAGFREADALRCAKYDDYRRLIDREKLDAVLIATPDHHHILAAMLACEAGMDVYVEKPLSLTIAEGRALERTVRRTGRVVQVGSQQRTMEMNRFACEWLRGGGLGRISRVDLSNYPGPMPLPRLPEEPVPAGLSWDLFCGPTPLVPHHRKAWVKEEFSVDGLLWRGWDLWRAYSGHLMTNWGAHGIDMVQYALGMDASGPVEIWPVAGPPAAELAREWSDKTPAPKPGESHDHLVPVAMRYANGCELHFSPGVREIVFHGERGKLYMTRNRFRTDPPGLAANAPDARVAEKWNGPGHVARPHIENWLECVVARTAANAPVEAGHRTATVCHLANLARQLRRRLRWDPAAERFAGDDEANGMLDRPRRKGFELPG